MKLVQKSEKEINIAELKEAINAGRGPEVIKPGDELEITLKNGERAIAVCADMSLRRRPALFSAIASESGTL